MSSLVMAVLALFVVFRLAYAVGVGVMLWREEHHQAFTKVLGVESGFRKFRGIASTIMNIDGVLFVLLCLVSRSTLALTWPPMAVNALALVLMASGVGIKLWAAKRLGMDGYYWKDFFDPSSAKYPDPPGPYRYLDNPMYTLGYLQTYGLALLSRSAPGLAAAAFSQVAVLSFHMLVEKPHVDRLLRGKITR